MKCLLCEKTCRCSCKGGGCPGCNSNNQTVQFMNELIKLWAEKPTIKSKISLIRQHVWKIDTFTMYEFLTEAITEEEFNKAVEEFKPVNKVKASPKKNEVEWFKPTPNPDQHHYFPTVGARVRCKYCNWIRKYCEKEICPMYKW